MCLIPLTRGKITAIDTEDYVLVYQHKWYALKASCKFYAARDEYINGRKVRIYMHRLLLGCVGKEQGHHIDDDSLNNHRSNLEKCSQSKNLSYRKRGVGVCITKK